jgi:hypothetical protein
MPYCITLRSRTDARITGWYAGRDCLWSTDHQRQKRFDNQHDARIVCHELRSRYPRNAEVINIEVAQDDPYPAGGSPTSRVRRREADAPSQL